MLHKNLKKFGHHVRFENLLRTPNYENMLEEDLSAEISQCFTICNDLVQVQRLCSVKPDA